jgi:hypothetical protein
LQAIYLLSKNVGTGDGGVVMADPAEYAKRYDYELFVSYARTDNESPSGPGPVSKLVRHLELSLQTRLGVKPRIFFDIRTGDHQATQLADLKGAVAKSALFLVIGSPAYVQREWPLDELSSFQRTQSEGDQADAVARTFVAELLPPLEGAPYPEPLPRVISSRFWTEDPEDRVISMLRPGTRLYGSRLEDLANKMRGRILELRGVAPVPSPNRRKVLIAQTSDDLDELADQLRRSLGQLERYVEILPSTEYPQGGAEFAAAFAADIARADLFVQLLGPRPSRRPLDLPGGYTLHQHRSAGEVGCDVLQWRTRDINVESVEDPAYRALLLGNAVKVSGFEEFKGLVLERAMAPPPPPPSSRRIAFIDADQEDLYIAESISAEFRSSPFLASIPGESISTSEIRKRREQMFTEAEVLVLVHGETHPAWVKGNIRLFDSLWDVRGKKPRALAVCTVPPARLEEFKSKKCALLQIDMTAGFYPEPVRAFVRELDT